VRGAGGDLKRQEERRWNRIINSIEQLRKVAETKLKRSHDDHTKNSRRAYRRGGVRVLREGRGVLIAIKGTFKETKL